MDLHILIRALRHTASGIRAEEAAVWLLDRHRHWLPQLAEQGLIATDPDSEWWAEIVWEEIPKATGPYSVLSGTASEWQILTIAVALTDAKAAARMPEALTSLSSLDESNRRLVLYALAWAAAGRDWASSLDLFAHHCPNCGWSDTDCVCSARVTPDPAEL